MNGHTASARVPRLGDLEAEVLAFVREVNPRKLHFLDQKGEWAENPEAMRDRISHALLYHLRSQSEEDKASFFAQTFSPFLTESRWPIAEKIAALSLEERKEFQEAKAEVTRSAAEVLAPLIRLIAEEERYSAALERLLAESSASMRREEAYSLILERIQPPLGIVTQIPPALFFPCLRLLLDGRIDPESGIPHLASLILSVFQDPRSTEALLQAMARFPVGFTKIRENLIYTLGNLREERAVDALIEVLEAADEIKETAAGRPTMGLLLEQKEEAIWALGKIGLGAVKAVPALATYADHSSAKLKTYLAWTLGEVGKAQKGATGGVSADVVIALLKLLKDKNRQIFEETVSALRKIDLPEFVHSLYLYHVGAVSILGLKPAQRGLYELSETLHYLLRTKKRTIIAVNGDSGTGKTYFCQAIADGFAGLGPEEILYLMRDSKRGQRVFNRLLGLPWLKKHIDPCYYQDYPLSEDEDDPEAYFRRFLEENSEKRLIILDGCRDRHYFQRVIDFFYLQGELDIEVNFRANFSTRRLNLETREFALESVKLHLQFLEEPALEDTSFYQEGLVILFDLDNSIASRLDREETRELFERPRIDSWGELIRIGDFSGETKTSPCREEKFRLQTFLDNRVFQTSIKGIADFALLGRTFFLAAPGRGLLSLSFERNEIAEWQAGDAFPKKVVGQPPDRLVTAHQDGTIRVWDSLEKRALAFASQLSSLTALAIDQAGRIYGGDETGTLRQWDLERRTARDFVSSAGAVRFLRYYPLGKLLAVEDGKSGGTSSSLRIIDFASLTGRSISLPPGKVVNGINVYHDGRIIAATSEAGGESRGREKNLLVLSPGDRGCSVLALSGHALGTKDCVTMGPKIITCGTDSDGTSSLRIWGSEFFVRTELGRLFIKP